MIYKIVQGNSFKLHILVRKLDISRNFKRLIDFDLNQATDIKVELIGCFCKPIQVPATVSGVFGNILACDIPSTLEQGIYNIKVSWKFNGSDMVSIERKIIRIVAHNAQSYIPMGIVEGETAGLFDLYYYVITDNQSTCLVSFVMDNIKFAYSINGEKKEVDMKTPLSYTTPIQNGKSLEVDLSPMVGYNIGAVIICMNGIDCTADYFDKDKGKILIPAVSGYVNIFANGDNDACYYGASSAKNMSELNIEDLAKTDGDLVNKTINIETTEDKPFVWFVSRLQLVFYQAGFEASMNSTRLGDLYYYWSDELVPGNDNIYSIKLK